jgi:hypothetical protein
MSSSGSRAKTPRNPDKKILVAGRIPPALYERVRAAAREGDRTLGGQVRLIIRSWAEQREDAPHGA